MFAQINSSKIWVTPVYLLTTQNTLFWGSSLYILDQLASSKWSEVRLFATPWTVAYRLLHPWDFPGKSTGVGCHFLLQGIFPTQGLTPGLLHCRQTLYHLSYQGRLLFKENIIKCQRGIKWKWSEKKQTWKEPSFPNLGTQVFKNSPSTI